MEVKRPNRGTNPSKLHKRGQGRFIFFRKKNREVREILKAIA
jgi:hypothetical protein